MTLPKETPMIERVPLLLERGSNRIAVPIDIRKPGWGRQIKDAYIGAKPAALNEGEG